MQLFIKNLAGKTVVLNLSDDSTVDKVMDYLKLRAEVLPENSVLLYNGHKIENNQNLINCGIQDNSTLQISGVLCGGIIEPTMRDLAVKTNTNVKVCRKCYARLPARAETCRKRKCGHCSDIRPKKVPRS